MACIDMVQTGRSSLRPRKKIAAEAAPAFAHCRAGIGKSKTVQAGLRTGRIPACPHYCRTRLGFVQPTGALQQKVRVRLFAPVWVRSCTMEYQRGTSCSLGARNHGAEVVHAINIGVAVIMKTVIARNPASAEFLSGHIVICVTAFMTRST
jgi:hypothetical protein